MNKRKQEYIGGKITIQTEDRWPEIEEYNLYKEEKQRIQDRHPSKPWEVQVSSGKGNTKDPFEKEWWDEWLRYKKEITDLILQPNGNFTKFLYQIRPERSESATRIWLRGRFNTDYYKHGKKKDNE